MDGKSGEVGSRYEHAGTTWKRRAVIPPQAGIHEGEGKQVEMSE